MARAHSIKSRNQKSPSPTGRVEYSIIFSDIHHIHSEPRDMSWRQDDTHFFRVVGIAQKSFIELSKRISPTIDSRANVHLPQNLHSLHNSLSVFPMVFSRGRKPEFDFTREFLLPVRLKEILDSGINVRNQSPGSRGNGNCLIVGQRKKETSNEAGAATCSNSIFVKRIVDLISFIQEGFKINTVFKDFCVVALNDAAALFLSQKSSSTVVVDNNVLPRFSVPVARFHEKGFIRGASNTSRKLRRIRALAINRIGIPLGLIEGQILITVLRLSLDDPVNVTGTAPHAHNVLGRPAAQGLAQQLVVLAKFALRVDLAASPGRVPRIPPEVPENLRDVGVRAELAVAHHRATSRTLWDPCPRMVHAAGRCPVRCGRISLVVLSVYPPDLQSAPRAPPSQRQPTTRDGRRRMSGRVSSAIVR